MLPRLASYLARPVALHMRNWGSNIPFPKTFFDPANTFLLINMNQVSAAACPPLKAWNLPPNNTVAALSLSTLLPSSFFFAIRFLSVPPTRLCPNPNLNGKQPIVASLWIITTQTMVFLPNSIPRRTPLCQPGPYRVQGWCPSSKWVSQACNQNHPRHDTYHDDSSVHSLAR